MRSDKCKMIKKKRKPWVYFAKSGKKSTTSQSPLSTKSSILDGAASSHKPGNNFISAHRKKQKRNGKLDMPSGTTILKYKKQTDGAVAGTCNSAASIANEITVTTATKTIGGSTKEDQVDKSNALKAKLQKKKSKRKLKILRRKEKEKKKGTVTSGSRDTLASPSQTKGSERTLGQASSHNTSCTITNKETAKDEEGDGKHASKKRKRKDELNAERKKKKKQGKGKGVSGESSAIGEAPHVTEGALGVAANWKVLESKLKASAPRKPKMKAENKNTSEKADIKKAEIWFDDVDPALLAAEKGGSSEHIIGDSTVAPAELKKITKCVALDCEMVGVGHEGKDSILARVSMVNEYGQCIYDKFVKPRERVTDFRTEFSGVRPKDLFKGKAEEFLTVQKEVADIMKDRILVGHALRNDMKVLYLGHPRRLIRDTATYPHFRELMKTKRPALKKLAKTVLGVTIQEGEHDSVEDAQTAMRLYTLHRTAWEKSLKHRSKLSKK